MGVHLSVCCNTTPTNPDVFVSIQTYYEEGFDIDKIEDTTQQAALRAMVKTYGQMPRQLFKEPHPARNKMTVFTTFRIRIGSVLKRLTAETVFDKLDNPYIPLYITPCKLKLKMPSQCFIGDKGVRNLEVVAVESVERYPSSLLYLSDSEGLIVVGPNTGFFPVTSGPHSSLLVLWSLWDNAVEVKSFTGEEIKLHHSLLDKVDSSYMLNKITASGYLTRLHVVKLPVMDS